MCTVSVIEKKKLNYITACWIHMVSCLTPFFFFEYVKSIHWSIQVLLKYCSLDSCFTFPFTRYDSLCKEISYSFRHNTVAHCACRESNQHLDLCSNSNSVALKSLSGIKLRDCSGYPWLDKDLHFGLIYSFFRGWRINGEWGFMGINFLPLILMGMNGDEWGLIISSS